MKPEKESFRGGLLSESYHCSTPLAKLTITHDLLYISTLGRKFEFKPEEVIGFQKRIGGLQIFHINPKVSKLIVFYCDPEKVLPALDSVGFKPCAPGTPESDGEYELYKYLYIIVIAPMVFIMILVITLMAISK